jgi:hypothetical protein
MTCDQICNKTVRFQNNAQVHKGGGTHRHSSSCSIVCEGELDEMGPLYSKCVLGRLQGHTRLGL